MHIILLFLYEAIQFSLKTTATARWTIIYLQFNLAISSEAGDEYGNETEQKGFFRLGRNGSRFFSPL